MIPQAPQQFNAVNFPADQGGCGFYRVKFPALSLTTIAKNTRFVESMKLIGDPRFFYDIRLVQVQRQINDAQTKYLLEFLKPLSESMGFWLAYSVDDVIAHEDIPPYNHARDAYKNDQFFANVKNILQTVDFLIVTTELLKDYYVEKYGCDENKVVVIPNYLPRWWIGEAYDPRDIKQNLDDNYKKPRIGLPLSSSHYDLTGKNNYIDDVSGIVPFIRDTVDKYQWVFMGHCPKKLEDLAIKRKIEILPGSDLLNYPREMVDRGRFQAIIAPLQDNVFNRCKSNIKLLEAWALGIPCIVQDLPCYEPYTKMRFKDNNQLQNQLDNLFRDKHKYMKIVKNNRRTVDYGDTRAPNGWWLEKNLTQWFTMFTAPQKTIRVDLNQSVPTHQNQQIIRELPDDEGSLELDLTV